KCRYFYLEDQSSDKAFNSENFYDVLSSLILIFHEKLIYLSVFIMDNVPFHIVKQIKTSVIA
ncbi:hypothetical protein H311_05056, partial [Anncaliia algerae PRA109]